MATLLGNAIKYNRSSHPQVKVSCQSHGGYHEIIVQDNGIGMSDEDVKNIFKPFVRLHGDSEFTGTGLGLAICEKNARRLGGSLRAESEPGVGSAFILTLPATA